jgi:chlorobactene glucosyltransferase
MALALSCFWLAIVGALIFRAFRQQQAFEVLREAPRLPEHEAASVTIIVPARNEAAKIGACLAGLANQTHPRSRLRMVVIDDDSSDSTYETASAIGRRNGTVEVTSAGPLPSGWTGKCHACWIGAQRDANSEWLCFIDADVRPDKELIASALHATKRYGLDFLSLTPRQVLDSCAERLVMPCGFYLLAFSHDVQVTFDPTRDDATACGQFILIRRAVYDAIGGHAAVSNAFSEDVELARLAKRNGWRTAICGGDRLLSARMYTGWRSLWPGVTKNLVDMMGGPARTMVTALLGLALAWASIGIPLYILLICAAHWTAECIIAIIIAFAASSAAFGFHISGTRYFRIPFWYGLLFPIGYSLGTVLAFDSVRRRMTGGTIWKDRKYPLETGPLPSQGP